MFENAYPLYPQLTSILGGSPSSENLNGTSNIEPIMHEYHVGNVIAFNL
jgi:hypothetical protein